MQAIVRLRQERKILELDQPELVFYVRGREVDKKKIERWMRDHGVEEDVLYLQDQARGKFDIRPSSNDADRWQQFHQLLHFMIFLAHRTLH